MPAPFLANPEEEAYFIMRSAQIEEDYQKALQLAEVRRKAEESREVINSDEEEDEEDFAGQGVSSFFLRAYSYSLGRPKVEADPTFLSALLSIAVLEVKRVDQVEVAISSRRWQVEQEGWVTQIGRGSSYKEGRRACECPVALLPLESERTYVADRRPLPLRAEPRRLNLPCLPITTPLYS